MIKEISQFCKLKTNGLLDPSIDTKPISHNFHYDILDWIDNYEIESDIGKYVFGKRENIYLVIQTNSLRLEMTSLKVWN